MVSASLAVSFRVYRVKLKLSGRRSVGYYGRPTRWVTIKLFLRSTRGYAASYTRVDRRSLFQMGHTRRLPIPSQVFHAVTVAQFTELWMKQYGIGPKPLATHCMCMYTYTVLEYMHT